MQKTNNQMMILFCGCPAGVYEPHAQLSNRLYSLVIALPSDLTTAITSISDLSVQYSIS